MCFKKYRWTRAEANIRSYDDPRKDPIIVWIVPLTDNWMHQPFKQQPYNWRQISTDQESCQLKLSSNTR